MPVSLTTISTCEFDALEAHLHASLLRRELHGVRHQIPDDLLQPARIAGHGSDARIDDRLNPYAFGVGGGLDRGDRVVDDERQLDRLHVQANLARHDARHVEHVLHDLRQPRGVALERLEPARGLLARQDAAAQQPRVADDRIERRAQLV